MISTKSSLSPKLNNKYKIKEEHLDLIRDALFLVKDNKTIADIQAKKILEKICPKSFRYVPYSFRKLDPFMKEKSRKESERCLEKSIIKHKLIMIRSTDKLRCEYYNYLARALSIIS